ncbi:MAG TPA: GNAT family N-acetyltransferase [Thermoleophilia bacterium]|nr:GNAT family N-acetyltransferase [Thermoleophilia bacterium]
MEQSLTSDQLRLRPLDAGDHQRVLAVIDEWWGGRRMSSRLSHVFFVHFRPTSFVLECDGELLGFLIGLVSQTAPDEAYVHFVGVHPGYRQLGLGRRLYGRFCTVAGLRGCEVARSHTAPENRLSIAFHQALGFAIDPGDGDVDGVSVWRDYAGPGEHRVRFVKRLGFVVPKLSSATRPLGPEPAAAVGW